jgi:hypothetical protein
MMEKTLYDAYIGSDAWRASPARLDALRRDQYRCRGCNTTDNLEVHHRTYAHFGHERPEDLTVLCRECHDAITSVIRRRRHATRPIIPVDVRRVQPGPPRSHEESPHVRKIQLQDYRRCTPDSTQWSTGRPAQ